jgi:high-affinity iron transporter
LNLNLTAPRPWVVDLNRELDMTSVTERWGPLTLVLTAALVFAPTRARAAAEVTGKVVMPEVCSPEVSPAVVTLEPVGGGDAARPAAGTTANVAVVNQRGLQFVPRVQAVTVGQTIRFTNEDAETHNVHVVSGGNAFNESMAPGQPHDFTPTTPGVVRLACDIHSHMRGFVVVSASPWVRVCSARGRFRLDDVPDGRYTLTVWHEMGDPLTKEVVVAGGKSVDLDALTLTARAVTIPAGQAAPARPWPDVIDRIGVLLSSSVDAAGKTNGFKKARKLAEDAYWVEFEASDMETAVRLHLGFARAAEIERQFRAVVPALRGLSKGERSAGQVLDVTRPLLLNLARSADELNKKGVTDGGHLAAKVTAPAILAVTAGPPATDADAQLAAVRAGFGRVAGLAERGEPDEAAAEMTAVYFDEFEPLERYFIARNPQEVRPLEVTFNAIRGAVGGGLKGPELTAKLDGLTADVTTALGRSRSQAAGTFAPAFAASLVTILREGVEVILLLTMLIALATKTGHPGALKAIGKGVALAVLASAATAVALNLMVASAGKARELVEGGVMLAAAGVLFYVSYWLISQSESKRWLDFLKRQATRGATEAGPADTADGGVAFTLTAFLAVYREGAEMALMYQAMIGTQAGSRAGLMGLAAGLGLGIVLLAAIAYVLRATSVRLPLRAFFQVTGGVLFAMAVVFAGNGVFALQSAGVIKTTGLSWLAEWVGDGVGWLGFYPNLQVVSVQGLLLAGAALALTTLRPTARAETSATTPRPTAGAGV